MRTRPLMLTLAAFVLAATSLSAQPKIGIINSAVIQDKYYPFKDAEIKLKAELDRYARKADAAKAEMQRIGEMLQKQGAFLSADRKKDLQDSLEMKYKQYQQFAADAETKLAEKKVEVLKPANDAVMAKLTEIAKANGYDFIFDRASGALIYCDTTKYDLTGNLLDLLTKSTAAGSKNGSKKK